MARRPATPESSIANLLDGLRREGMLTERSIEFYGEQAKVCLKDLRALGIEPEPWSLTQEDARRLLAYWEAKRLAVATRRGYLAALRTWTAYYGNKTIVDMRVLLPSDSRPNADWLTDEQARQLLSFPKDEVDDLIVHCELCLGMRRVEVLRLRVSDFCEGFVEITGKGPRGGKPRRMPYHRDTQRIYAAWMRKRLELVAGSVGKIPDELIIYRSGRSVKTYGDTGIDRRLKILADALGFSFSNHTLRRTFGRTFWRAGVKIETISKMLGHTSIDMTLKYIGADMDDMTAAMGRFTL